MVVLRHVAELSDVLKITVKMSARWSAHSRNPRPGMLSGPAVFYGFTL